MKQAQTLLLLNPDRISIYYTNQDDIGTYVEATSGAEGVFAVTDFYNNHLPQMPKDDPEKEKQEEKHAQNVIDACAQSGSVRHIVFSTLESLEDVDKELQGADGRVAVDGNATPSARNIFDGKMRIAAYARSKRLSVTFVLMPVYSEDCFHALTMHMSQEDMVEIDDNKSEQKVVCMSVDDLGPAVANILDSYEVYAGHEIALTTDMLSLKEASDMIKEVFFETNSVTAVTMSDSALGPSPSTVIALSRTSTKRDQDEVCNRLSTFAKDLGSMFSFMNKSQAVKRRQTIAKTMGLVPDARTFRQWLEENRDNVQFRAMLGIR